MTALYRLALQRNSHRRGVSDGSLALDNLELLVIKAPRAIERLIQFLANVLLLLDPDLVVRAIGLGFALGDVLPLDC